ncbi:MAG: isoamylase early set domain-containing protein [Armatimonadetes bacterium]|nr:isoamylase early set domain-containing protein [Armatimonadota bacterium]
MAATEGRKRAATGASDGKKRVMFRLEAPEARQVALAGSFNDWRPDATLLQKDTRGTWRTQLSLPQGCYEYRYVVDGEWRDDPSATEFAPNPFGGSNCIRRI